MFEYKKMDYSDLLRLAVKSGHESSPVHEDNDIVDWDGIIKGLNIEGSIGWELVSIVKWRYYFKRSINKS